VSAATDVKSLSRGWYVVAAVALVKYPEMLAPAGIVTVPVNVGEAMGAFKASPLVKSVGVANPVIVDPEAALIVAPLLIVKVVPLLIEKDSVTALSEMPLSRVLVCAWDTATIVRAIAITM